MAGGSLWFSASQKKAAEAIRVVSAETVDTSLEVVAEPVLDISGLRVNILCDMNAADTFGEEGEVQNELSKAAVMRNEQLESDTGAVITVTPTADFYLTASNDISAGTYNYNFYAADAAESVSWLLSAGQLHDVSKSKYINTKKDYYDSAVMEKLSFYGGKYIISSSAADARLNSAVVVYNRDAEPVGERSLAQIALDGEFTVGTMLAYQHMAYKSGENPFYGLSYGEEDVFSLYFGVGGMFVSPADEFEVEPLSNVKSKLSLVKTLVSNDFSVCGTANFAAGEALFSVKKLSEIPALRESVPNLGILPLPKANEESEYSGYVNLSGVSVTAIPSGVPDVEKIEYFVDKMAKASADYITPIAKYAITAGNAEDEQILEIVAANASCDLSCLFGYGDMDKLFADIVTGKENRLELKYYERKALYEKAFSIIEKRFN